MSHRLIALLLLLASLLAIFVGYALLKQPELLGLCVGFEGGNCLGESLIAGIAKPLYVGLRGLPILFLLLMFVPKTIFFSWLKFSAFALPVPVFLIIVSPATTPEIFTPERLVVTAPLVNLYVALSLGYIALKLFLLKRKEQQNS